GTPQITAMWMAAPGHAAYSWRGSSCLGLEAGDVAYRWRRTRPGRPRPREARPGTARARKTRPASQGRIRGPATRVSAVNAHEARNRSAIGSARTVRLPRVTKWCVQAMAAVYAASVSLAAVSPAAAQGLPLIRDTKIENLLKDYSVPIFKAAG